MRSRTAALGFSLIALGLAACATPAADSSVYAMPADPARALSPGEADPDSAAELAEGALYLLNPERPSGPDYPGAARLCLLSAEVARLPTERQLQRTCHRVAARSALRSGERELYLEAIEHWESRAPRNERAAGELAIHLAIRDELSRRETGTRGRVPSDLRWLLPSPGSDQ